jgi:phosphatidylethanolamine-binding protein (PEBP) family uncharacterized protein
MAQRTGADGLIAPKAKAASAGILPALAVAALLALAGCGGGSGDDTQSTAADAQASGQEATDPGGSSQSKSKSQSSASSGTSAQASPDSPDPSGTQSASGTAKHGAQIKQPKGELERAPSAAEKANSALASIALQSPDLPPASGSETELPATYTCDGKNVPPDLRWSGVPAGTSELVLFVLGLEPVNEALFFNWAVAGIDPGLEGIEAGQLPKGVSVGQNSFGKNGYSVCSTGGKSETFIFALYALPQALSPEPGFDPATLRQQILGLSGNVGLMAASYGG